MDLQLGKKVITSTIGTLSLYSEHAKIENFENDLKRIKKKAKKEKYSNVRVEIIIDEGDGYRVSKTTFAVIGDRLETEEEWHSRLEYAKYKNILNIDDIIREYNALELYNRIDEQYQAAIEKTSIRCEECGKPATNKTFYHDKKLCNDCKISHKA